MNCTNYFYNSFYSYLLKASTASFTLATPITVIPLTLETLLILDAGIIAFLNPSFFFGEHLGYFFFRYNFTLFFFLTEMAV